MRDDLTLGVEAVGGCLVGRLSGATDLSSAAELEGKLRNIVELGERHLVVDLTTATFLDSAALAALVSAHYRARVLGGSVRLAGATGPVRTILEMTHVDRILEHHDDVAAAVAAAVSPDRDSIAESA
ncbi:MAG TPA: STAS domain-containing protein [Jiangellaceae bacterium]|nr:STAS domain-containing protein [Jiangellaceae bacterium]